MRFESGARAGRSRLLGCAAAMAQAAAGRPGFETGRARPEGGRRPIRQQAGSRVRRRRSRPGPTWRSISDAKDESHGRGARRRGAGCTGRRSGETRRPAARVMLRAPLDHQQSLVAHQRATRANALRRQAVSLKRSSTRPRAARSASRASARTRARRSRRCSAPREVAEDQAGRGAHAGAGRRQHRRRPVGHAPGDRRLRVRRQPGDGHRQRVLRQVPVHAVDLGSGRRHRQPRRRAPRPSRTPGAAQLYAQQGSSPWPVCGR